MRNEPLSLDQFLLQKVPPLWAVNYANTYFKGVKGRVSPGQRGALSLWLFTGQGEDWASLRELAQAFPDLSGWGQCQWGGKPAQTFACLFDSLQGAEIDRFIYRQEKPFLRQALEQALTEVSTRGTAPLKARGVELSSQNPLVMGVLNLTPDSFYDGGRYQSLEAWQGQARKMVEEGADLLDLGAESTRPGADPVEAKEQLQRLLPPLEWIKANYSIPLSIDTGSVEVAATCLQKGAHLINDVTGLSGGTAMLDLLVQYRAGYLLMHCQKQPKTMQDNPQYQNPLLEVRGFLQQGLGRLIRHGVKPEQVLVDPGIGFGKTFKDNQTLLAGLQAFAGFGAALALGTSNKSFIGQWLGLPAENRLFGSLTTQVLGRLAGALVFRVHEVGPTRHALDMCSFYQ